MNDPYSLMEKMANFLRSNDIAGQCAGTTYYQLSEKTGSETVM